ncbi:MAG: sensor histidine kinase [Mycobacteriales bacterium]
MAELAPEPRPGPGAGELAAFAGQLLATLTSGALVIDPADQVVLANPAALALGVVKRNRIEVRGLLPLVRAVRSDGLARERTVTLPAQPEPPLRLPRKDREGPTVRVRVSRFGLAHVALVIEDVTEARRVEAVRRDFVANVSHELKTPVGALVLLAEAISGASDDPLAVRRFAERMTREGRRLSKLVQELIDLSRLQGAEAPPEAIPVSAVSVVSEAVDRTGLLAQAKAIDVGVVPEGDLPLVVSGDEGQLVTAVANLLDNAISYSPAGTRVVVGIIRRSDVVEISVVDEGIGIAEPDLERVFERFYRVDPARSRATGGTGLGLAIVKHIATNHGGEVTVWSSEGAGSTFTLRLPAADVPDPA